ncbi:secretion system protein [[Pantoea] beijingensis]|uniref:Secretion system protein n=1 Tax=[Pantoea] beijingensis TaxID=1324864 RepID=A0A443IGY4_9GAMM|nr:MULTISPECIES: type II secretion system F family protein [Erwiniaceae]RWR03302.1 secretion system protein [[Pantoea] beijingensis]
MFYFILLAGLFFLVMHYLRIKRINNIFLSEVKDERRESVLIRYFSELFNEWRKYVLADRSAKGKRKNIITIFIVAGMMFVNYNWLSLNWGVFILLLAICMFWGQIQLGRLSHIRHFEKEFPNVLTIINSAVSAGNSIHQAMHRCGKEVGGNLGKTFNRIDRRLNVGEDTERVMLDAWTAYPYREFYFFIVVMQVSIERGGQIRSLVGRLSRSINNARKMERRKKSMTSEARASAKIVAMIPVLFFLGMKYLSPENFDFIIHDPIGRYILYYVIISEIIGMSIIWLLLKRAV